MTNTKDARTIKNTPSAPARTRSPWLVIVGSGVAGSVGPAAVVLATLGLFVVPITSETGWGRTTVTGAYSVAAVGMAIGLVVVGRLLDMIAIRFILIPSFVLYGGFTALIGLTPPDNVILYLLPYFALGLTGAGTAMPFGKALISWFDNKRGIAGGVMGAITNLGSSLVPLLAAALIAGFGWRTAYPLLGLFAVVVATSMILLFVRVRAERSRRGRLLDVAVDESRHQTVSLELPGLTLGQALRSYRFWFLTLAFGVAGATVIGLQVHLVPLMSDRGLGSTETALLLSIFGLSALFSLLVGGLLLDRLPARIVGAVVLALPIVGIFLLQPPFALVAVGVAMVGLALGMEGVLLGVLVTRYLGVRAYGSIMGVIQPIFLLGTAFGPLVLGVGYDTFRSYDTVLPVLAVGLGVAALLILLLGSYSYPAVAGFDRVAAQDELAASEILASQAAIEDPKDEAPTAGEPDVDSARTTRSG